MTDKIKTVIVDLEELNKKIEEDKRKLQIEKQQTQIIYKHDCLSFSRLTFAISAGTLSFLLVRYLDNIQMLNSWLFRLIIGLLLIASIIGVSVQLYIYKTSFFNFYDLYRQNSRTAKCISNILSSQDKELKNISVEYRLLYWQLGLILLTYFFLIVKLFF